MPAHAAVRGCRRAPPSDAGTRCRAVRSACTDEIADTNGQQLKGENLSLDQHGGIGQNSRQGYQRFASTRSPTVSTCKSSNASGISARCTTSVVGPICLQLCEGSRLDNRKVYRVRSDRIARRYQHLCLRECQPNKL